MQFYALEKSVMKLQIIAFNNYNKWTPVYKDKYTETVHQYTEDKKFIF